jgi:hypothetical protein
MPAQDHISGAIAVPDPGGRCLVEEVVNRVDPGCNGNLRNVDSRFNTEGLDAGLLKILEDRPVIAGNLDDTRVSREAEAPLKTLGKIRCMLMDKIGCRGKIDVSLNRASGETTCPI